MARRFILRAVAIFLAAILFIATGAFAAPEKQPPSHPVDINVANAKELEQLPGIGAVTAQAIINFRQKSGPFHRVEDLLAIRGISVRRLDRMRPYLRVGAPAGKPIAKPAPKPLPKPAAPASKPATAAPSPTKSASPPTANKSAGALPTTNKSASSSAKPDASTNKPASSAPTQTKPSAPAASSQQPSSTQPSSR